MILYSSDLSPYSAKVRLHIYAMSIDDDFGFDWNFARITDPQEIVRGGSLPSGGKPVFD